MAYNEILHRGTGEFTIELYRVDEHHPRYHMAHHWHSAVEIIRVLTGELILSINNTEYRLTQDSIAIINPDFVHGAQPSECVYEVIVFQPEGLFSPVSQTRNFCEELLSGNILLDEVYLDDKEIITAANRLFEALKTSYDYYHIEVIAALYSLFGAIIKKGRYHNQIALPYSQCDKKILKLKKAISYMRKNYQQQLSLNEISETAGMSSKYFCSAFKELTHQTPFEYLTAHRIERAKQLLTETDDSITNIAYTCGFNDLSYFIKTFKAKTETTPSAYRKGL